MADLVIQKMLSNRPDLYCSQGHLAGGCATHAAAAALAVLDVISSPGRIAMRRGEPNARRLWAKLKDAYADGVSLAELAQRLRELEFSAVRIEHVDGPHFKVLAFTVDALQRRRPVIVSFAPGNRPRHLHAVLCIGLSGGMEGRRFVPAALLITDSAEEPPGFGPVNARLEFSVPAKRERAAEYVTAWNRCRVTLKGAIALQRAGTAKNDLEQP